MLKILLCLTVSILLGISPPPTQTRSPITLQNAHQLKEVGRLGRGSVRDIAWSPNGELLAVASASGLWLHESRNFQTAPRHFAASNLTSLAFSSDGKLIATGGEDGIARLWEVGTGKQQQTLKGNGQIADIAFNNDLVAIAQGGIRLWNVETNEQTRLDLGGEHIAFSPDGKTLSVGGVRSGKIEVWDVATRTQKFDVDVTLHVYSMDYSLDGTRFTAGGQDDHVYVFDSQTGDYLDLAHGFARMYQATLNHDGSLLATGTLNGEIGIFQISGEVFNDADLKFYFSHGKSTHAKRGDVDYDDTGAAITSLKFSPTDNLLASAGADGVVRIWDAEKEVEIAALDQHAPLNDFDGPPVEDMIFSADDKTISVVNKDIIFRQWDVQTSRQLSLKIGPQLYLGGGMWPRGISAVLNANLTFVARGHILDGRIDLWEVATGKSKLMEPQFNDAKTLSFSYDGNYLASGDYNRIYLWNIPTDQECIVFEVTEEHLHFSKLAFSPDSRLLMAGTQSGDLLWVDVASKKWHLNKKVHNGFVTALAFDPESKLLASGNTDGYDKNFVYSICLWNAHSTKKRNCFNVTSGIDALAFSPNGQILASVQSNGDLRLWHINTGKQLASYQAGASSAVTFNHAGTLIATAGLDGMVRLWGLN